jgi:hypothetical protein
MKLPHFLRRRPPEPELAPLHGTVSADCVACGDRHDFIVDLASARRAALRDAKETVRTLARCPRFGDHITLTYNPFSGERDAEFRAIVSNA